MLHHLSPQVQEHVVEVVDAIHTNFQHLHAMLQAREKVLLAEVNEACKGSTGPVHDLVSIHTLYIFNWISGKIWKTSSMKRIQISFLP